MFDSKVICPSANFCTESLDFITRAAANQTFNGSDISADACEVLTLTTARTSLREPGRIVENDILR